MNGLLTAGAFEKVKDFLDSNYLQNKPAAGFNVYPSVLRLENNIETNKTSYTFDLYEGNSGQIVTERRLNRNNLFFGVGIALALQKIDSNEVSRYPIFHYPDPAMFSGDDGSGTAEFEQLQAFYNGLLTISTSPNERFRNYQTCDLMRVPETQGSVEGGDADRLDQYPSFVYPDWVYQPLYPLEVLDGLEDNRIELRLGAQSTLDIIDGSNDATGASSADTRRNKVIVFIKGFEVNNLTRR